MFKLIIFSLNKILSLSEFRLVDFSFQRDLTRPWFVCRVAPVLGSSTSSSSSSSAPLSSGSSSFDSQAKPPPSWKELLKTSAPYGDNHHYYSTEYPCRYPGNSPGSPAALQTIITTTTKVRTTPVVDH